MTGPGARRLALALAALTALAAPALASPLVLDAAAPGAGADDAPRPAPGAGNPWLRLADLLAADPHAALPALAAFVASGFDDDAIESGLGATYSYTYLLGDTDGDGAADFGFDTYCVDGDGCGGTVNPARVSAACTPMHTLWALGGIDGDDLWKIDLDPEVLVPGTGCTIDLVVDTVARPESDLRDPLIYRWDAKGVQGAALLIDHTITLVDATNGQPRWTYTAQGSYAGTMGGLGGAVTAENLFLIPILQGPRAGPDTGADVSPTLHVRGWGFSGERARYSHVDLGPIVHVYDYKPRETLSRIDLADGAQRWSVASFTAEDERSVVPESYHAREWRFRPVHAFGPSSVMNPFAFQSTHYDGTACCGDLTGDGVPDVVFTTMEWHPVQTPHMPSTPVGLGSRVVVFNGENGQRMWSLALETADPALRTVSVAAVGDADGDGADDLATTRLYHDGYTEDGVPIDPVFLLEVRRGHDGTPLWDLRDVAPVPVQPLGDADGDGGSDLLTAWYGPLVTGTQSVAAVGDIDLQLRHGATGVLLWNATTQAGALDALLNQRAYSATGLPDLNADGVAEIWTDALTILDDQTVAHRISTLSGRNGQAMHSVDALGAYAIPLGLEDVTGDGRHDFYVIQGDLLDLWMTTHNGANGTAEWSRRLMSVAQASPVMSVPRFRYYNADIDGSNGTDVFLSFDLTAISASARDGVKATSDAQILALAGREGSLFWARPEVEEGDASLLRYAPSPATDQYVANVQQTGGADGRPQGRPGSDARDDGTVVAAAVATGALSLGAAFAIGFLRRRP